MVNIRLLAVEILTKMEQQSAYSNLLLRHTLDSHDLDPRDAALLTELVYGSAQRMISIDIYLKKLIAKGIDSFAPWLRACLRMSMYQLFYLDKIPDHAIVNEAVQIAKQKGHLGIAKLVNGVLRNAIRHREQWKTPPAPQSLQAYSLLYSCPEWLLRLWFKQYGIQQTTAICESMLKPAHTTVRVNRLKTTREQLLAEFQTQQIQASPSTLSPDGIVIERGGNPVGSAAYQQGKCTIQDESSMLVARALNPQPGMSVLDCCAAPGGKATHLAELMEDRGAVIAVDIHPHKQQLIEHQAIRLGLQSVRAVCADASELIQDGIREQFDRILLDAPCSGLGVIRRKPEIKSTKSPVSLQKIVTVQKKLLTSVAAMLKKDGILVYSTCTLNKHENEYLIQQFLASNKQFSLDDQWPDSFGHSLLERARIGPGMLQIMPHEYHSDGFFIARIRRL